MAVTPPPQRNRTFAVLGGLIVAVAGVAGTVYLSSHSQQTGTGNTSGGGPTTRVVVARLTIAQGTKVTLANVTTADVPTSTVPQGFIDDPNKVNGLYSAVDIAANQVLLPSLVVQAPSAAAPTPINPIRLKDDEVALAIPNDPLKGAGGFIQTGDHIDIMADVNGAGAVKYAFQNVLVLKTGSTGHAEGTGSDLLVIALPRRQAEELGVLLGGKGTPATIARYVLRPATQNDKGYLLNGPDIPDTAAAAKDTPVTPQQLNALFAN